MAEPSINHTDKKNSNHNKGLINIFAGHPVAANLLMLIMILAGVYTLMGRINIQLFPLFNLDVVSVKVVWTGASADDVQEAITIPIEQELRSLDNLKKMTATSNLGFATIMLEFEENTDISEAVDQTKEYVSLVQRNLPPDAEEPEISRVLFFEPVAKLLVFGPDDPRELRPLVREFERELLDRGIAKVNVVGLPEEEIAIQISSEQLAEMNVSLEMIADRINQMSQDLPAGTAGRSELSQQLRSLEQRRDFLDFMQLPLMSDDQGRRILLSDIAEIEQRPRDLEPWVTYQGRPAVELQLLRAEAGNTLEAARIMQAWIEETLPTLPPNIHVQVYEENWQYLSERIRLLLKNGIGGMILIVLILFVFLNGRVAWWVAVGVPVSFLATIAVIYMLGGSINMISLFALIMALGIIVDDTIVVGENTLTHLHHGVKPLAAARRGAHRMFAPVVASSLTTIATFTPLLLITGVIGNILIAIPITVICVIIASLVECFLVLPGHLHHSFKKGGVRQESKFRRRIDNAVDRFREIHFRKFVTKALNHRGATVSMAFAVLLLMISLVLGGRIPFTFFPSPEGAVFMADAQFTAGTSPDKVDRFLFEVEEALYLAHDELKETYGQDILVNAVVFHRISAPVDTGSGATSERGDQYGHLEVELVSPDERRVTNSIFLEAWRRYISEPAGLEGFSIVAQEGGPPGEDIDVQLMGDDPFVLKAAAIELAEHIRQFSGVSNVRDDLPFGQEQLIYQLTLEGEALGLTTIDVGRQLRAAFDGQVAQTYYQAGEELEVRVVLPDDERHGLAALSALPILTPEGRMVPLASVVTFEPQPGLERLRRTDTKLTVHVTAEVDARAANANRITREINREFLPDLALRYGLTYSLEGKAAEQIETFGDMKQGLLFALILIYVILAWVFGSYLWPIAIMLVIPFGLSGAIFGHWVMGLDLTILSLFGFFGLSGIVINDSIILISFYKDLRAQGIGLREAIIEASVQRVRAVILTSITTIAGLLPLLFETSLQAQFLIPMAVSIAFGLAFATALVLIVMPVFLYIQESWTARLMQWRAKHTAKPEQIKSS